MTDEVIYRARAKSVLFRLAAPIVVLGVGFFIYLTRDGWSSDPVFLMAIPNAVLLPLAGVYFFIYRHNTFPPITLSDTGLSVVNYGMAFNVDWQDIDRERSSLMGFRMRLYRTSKPHFPPLRVLPSFYNEGLREAIIGRLRNGSGPVA